MERSYSILVKAIPEVDRTETTLMQAVKNAIEDASGGGALDGSRG